jgi:S1-C subfamily serine protease
MMALAVESRPSFAVALALRTGAPIRVGQRLLDEAPRVNMAPPDSSTDIARMMGLTVVTPTPEVRKLFGLPDRAGVVVARATEDAASSGMRRGDLILSVNGRPVTTPTAFREAVRDAPAGRPVLLRVWRDGAELDVQIDRAQVPPSGVRA